MGKVAFLACVLTLAFAFHLEARQRDIILVTDCGADIDDQWAIAYMLLSPEIRLRGIVTTHAPNPWWLPPESSRTIPPAQASADCVHEVLHHLQFPNPPPVLVGSSVPLAGVHPLPSPAVDFILRMSRQYSRRNRLTLVIVGAARDVTSAFLMDPTISDRVEILSMGFESWPQGKDVWNVKNDSLAYKLILQSQAPITVGCGAVCLAHLELNEKQVNDMLQGCGKIGAWLADVFRAWITKYGDFIARAVGPGQWPISDLVTIAHLLGYTQTRVYPRPTLNTVNLTFNHVATHQTINWITDLNEKLMWADFIGKIDRYNGRPLKGKE